MRLLRTTFLLLISLCGLCVSAQQIKFRHYTVNEGLCSNTVRSIAQDYQGYFWFGTKDGLNRFDGYTFKAYRNDKSNPFSLGSNFIHKILVTDSTHLWVATDMGVYILDLQTDRFEALKQVEHMVVFDLMKDRAGRIWLSTRNNGVYCYKPSDKSLANYSVTSRTGRISANQVRRTIEADNGEIWIGTFGAGIDVLNQKTGLVRHYRKSSAAGSLGSDQILELYKDRSGAIWVGTLSGGISRMQKGASGFTTWFKAPNSINDNSVRAIFESTAGKIYIGTEKGLNIFDTASNKFSSYTVSNSDPQSIGDNAIYSILKDREGGIWVGTYFGGVNYFREKDTGFELYYPTGNANALSGKAVSGFLEDKNGEIWIGTEDGGLNSFNQQSKTFKHYPFKPGQQNLSYHNIHSLFRDNTGKIWIGTFTGGLNLYDPKTGKVKTYRSDPGDSTTLSNSTAYAVYQDRSGTIWVGTVSGLNRYDAANDRFIRIKQLDFDCIYTIHEDAHGNLWFGTYDNGLIGREKATGKWVRYSPQKKGNSISSNKVISMFDDHAGNLWIGTDGGGLNIFNIRERSFTTIGAKQGINSAVIYGILQDNGGKIWLSSNNGIYRYDPETGTSIHYTQWDNLQSKQFNYCAAYRASDGKFYFGGINGFNAFYPDSLVSQRYVNPVLLTNFQLFNKDVSISDENSPLQRVINFTKAIRLSYDQSVINIDYAALNFQAPQKTQYAYQMEGFDRNWNYVGDLRRATYTNLPPGQYTFRVKSTDNQGNWNPLVTELRISVDPPWYRSALAYFIYVVLAVASIIAIRRYMLAEAGKRNQIRLERLKNKEEQEFYKQKIDFFTTMAHEIRTPLSLIAAPLERLMGDNKWAPEISEQFHTIGENSDRLQKLVGQLLDFRRIESDIYEINKENIEIVALVQSMYTRFYPVAQQKGLKFSIETKINSLVVPADPEAMTKILSNLLVNAFKFTRTRVKLRVMEPECDASGQNVLPISVEDDGIGIPAEHVNNIFKKFFKVTAGQYDYSNLGGTGIGLALAKSLSEKHGGDLHVESIEGKKTIFTVKIPFVDEPAETAPVEIADAVPAELTDKEKPLIMVVEDDRSMLSFITRSLQADGYRVVSARNGAQAHKMLDEHYVDLILSDVMMPDIDGMQLCKMVKSDINFSHIPFILLTAKANSDSEIQGFENGADAFIVKPFKWKHVVVVVRNLLDSRLLLRDKFIQQPLAEGNELGTNNRDTKFIQKIIHIIEERITDPQLSVEELSREMAMSRSSLHKKLKSMTGDVPNEFIRVIRLKHAAKLLMLNEYNVSEVGYMAGFNSHSYFSKCFYQQFHQTPTEFAEKHKSETVRS